MPTYVSEREFIELWRKHGSALEVSRATGLDVRNVYTRRQRLKKRGYDLPTTNAAEGYEGQVLRYDTRWTFPRQIDLEIDTGVVVVSSDHHYWPDEIPLAHRALIEVIKLVKPRAKILNGDVFDGVSVSRHPPFGWSDRPTVKDELEACQERVHEIEMALPRGCKRLWNVGNHCIRFERVLAMQASEFAGFEGTRLADHFGGWDFAWSTLVNESAHTPTMIKHRFASAGVHAGYNATLKSGVHTVSGHTHRLGVNCWGDYRGRRYGIQTGTISDLNAPAFEYTENNPTDACSGFVVLTFKDKQLLYPEICEVIEGEAWFRGQKVA